MARKCVVCGNSINENDEIVPYKKRFAHKNCFNQAIKMIRADKNEELKKKEEEKKVTKTKKQTIKAELKDGLSDEEYKEKKEYYNYVKDIIGVDKLNAKIYVISERFITQYGFTWESMKATLVYLKEIKNKLLTGDVVSIIPYYYDEAKNFYGELEEVEKKNKNINVENLYTNKVVRVKPSKRQIKQLSFDE